MASPRLIGRIRHRFDRQFVEPLRRARRSRANRTREFQPLFVSGAMGSGTTLLGLEIAQRFVTSGIVDESCLLVPKDAQLHVEPIKAHPRIRDYEVSLMPRADWDAATLRAEMQALYRSRADRGEGPFVDKAANAHVHRLAILSECYPEAGMLVIFRDPVANIEGFRRKWPVFGNDTLEENIRFYRDLHERFLASRNDWRGPCLLISYEALIADADATLELIRTRLCLDSAERGRRLEKRANLPGQGIRNIEGGRIQIVADANDHAIRGLESAEVSAIRNELHKTYESLQREADNT